MTKKRNPVSSLQSPVSSLQSPVSSLQSPVSSLQSPVSSLQSPVSNWVRSGLMVQQTTDCGWGVFSAEPIAAGDLVVVYGGRVVTSDQVRAEDLQDWVIQIEEDLFLSPWRLPEEDEPGAIAERINHCCRPNLGFAGQVSVVAICDIPTGAELTLDYGTCDSRTDYRFECRCGIEGCRKTVCGEDWRDPGLQARLLDYYQPFLQRRVRQAGGAYGSIL